jgi:hypothetical protein
VYMEEQNKCTIALETRIARYEGPLQLAPIAGNRYDRYNKDEDPLMYLLSPDPTAPPPLPSPQPPKKHGQPKKDANKATNPYARLKKGRSNNPPPPSLRTSKLKPTWCP